MVVMTNVLLTEFGDIILHKARRREFSEDSSRSLTKLDCIILIRLWFLLMFCGGEKKTNNAVGDKNTKHDNISQYPRPHARILIAN